MMQEFYDLAAERLAAIHTEEEIREPYCRYFKRVAFFLLSLMDLYKAFKNGEDKDYDLAQWEEINELLYADVLPQLYNESYADPAFACRMLPDEYGKLLSFVYTLCRSAIPDVFEENGDALLRKVQYFLSLYSSFTDAAHDGKDAPDITLLKEGLYEFIFYSYEDESRDYVRSAVVPEKNLAMRLVCDADHNDISYLYRYGEYITSDQIETARYLTALPKEQLQLMADTFTEGYRIGFEKTGKDITKKSSVEIVYTLGFEPVIKLAVENFEKIGLKSVIRRNPDGIFFGRYGNVIGYTGENPNRQYGYDHREDKALFWDGNMAKRRLDCMENAYKLYK
ncbi:MAG: hypothetical protein J5842_02350 [Lachnospiraceae bacterium]|nr:hypothetical protein [Lachnospiraceae bacterium]